MTVQTTTNYVIYQGTGITTIFPYNFKFPEMASVNVTLLDEDNEIIRVLNPDEYTVTGVGANSGTVIYTPAPPIGRKILIARLVPYTQDLALTNEGGFYPETLEDQLDRIVMQIQQLASETARAWKSRIGEEGGVLTKVPEGHIWVAEYRNDGSVQMVDGGPGDTTAIPGLVERAENAAESAEDSAERANRARLEAQLYDPTFRYASVPDLLASTREPGVAGTLWQGGSFLFREAASGSLDYHVETAGGVKLYEAGPVFSALARMARQAGSADAPFTVLADPLRKGDFFWTDSDCAALVSRDPEQGLVVAPADEPTGQFGAYVRKFYGTPSLDWFGVADNGFDQSSKIHHAFDAIGTGEIQASPGVFLCNILIPNSIHLSGAGKRKTSFQAANTGVPIIEMGDSGGFSAYYIGLSGCEIDGKGTAEKGLYLGRTSAGRTVTYGELSDVTVRDCIDNIDVNNVVGLDAWGVYSFGATQRGLHLGTSAIGTEIKFRRSAFRQNEIGVNANGSGALVDFDNCVIESNRDVGLYFNRLTTAGARQMTFRVVWFENNGHSPSTGATSSIYIDMISTGVTDDWPSYLAFENCVVSSPGSIRDVFLNRASEVEFRQCSFTSLTPIRLHAATGTGYAYATLRDCGTYLKRPSPTLYAAFPPLVTSGDKRLGFKYEYLFDGRRYTNIEDA